jgi:predicted phosphodiesterase
MKILFISDTHTRHNELIIPDGIDMIIHSGDEANSANPMNNSVESTLLIFLLF